MEELIKTFHIDWKLMVAQIFNFALVFWALYLIAAKPLTKLVKERKEEIEGGLENARQAEVQIKNAHLEKAEIVKEAKKDAKQILDASQVSGKDILKEAKDKAILEKEEIIKQGKMEAEKEKEKADELLRKEASVLVSQGVQKVIEGYVAKGKGEDLINAMLSKN